MIPVGAVVAINRHPVKSMQAEPLRQAALHWTWLHGDRQFAFVKESGTTAFPWLTARDVPALVLHRATYAAPDDPGRSPVQVAAPDGAVFDVRDPALAARLAEAAGEPVRLLRLGRGAFDAMPLSLATTATFAAVSAAHGSPLSPGRFRANIVVAADDPAATERDWEGHALAFGPGAEAPCLALDWGIPRCAMVGIDPDTAARDPSVLRTVAQRFGNRVGMYCAVRRPGTVRVGDRVYLAG